MTGKTVAVIGYQFGDEGKGKIVDLLSSLPYFHASARFNGGNNAGHTVVKGGRVFKLHIIPSSIVEGKPAIISHGTVVDPAALEEELKVLQASGINTGSLVVCENAHLIMPYHIETDKGTGQKIGTTGRGIGPSYADKAHRTGMLVGDLLDKEKFLEKTKELGRMDEASAAKYLEIGGRLKPYIKNSFESICRLLDGGKNIILEGAQGTLLDIDLGNYPYVTSSHTTVAGALSGTGLAKIDSVLGVVKAYITRVGNGPLPTELLDETGGRIREQGREFGTTTGRARRCGWLDIPLLRYAAKVNGTGDAHLAITKLDVLDGLDKVKMCTSYRINGKATEMPYNVRNLGEAVPVYEEMEGWNIGSDAWGRIAKEGYEALPEEAKAYLDKIEELAGVPVLMVSIGPERNQTVFKHDANELVA